MSDILFAKEDDAACEVEQNVYKLLIVDDEALIHNITNTSLKAITFKDFTLQTLSAYSAKEAKEILSEHKDIALALVDVVMESNEAGLDLVNYIRNDLQNSLIRLVIRTGQANEFPPMTVLEKYDINDFKEKTDLTIDRLFITIRNSIKEYQQLTELKTELYRQLKQIEKALDEHTIVSHTDLHGTIIDVNDKFINISGYSKEELVGRNHNIINSGTHPPEFWKDMYSKIVNKKAWRNEVCNKAKDGSLYWVDTTVFPLLDKEENVLSYMSIRTDISQRKMYEFELMQAKNQAELSANAKSEFLAMMSHEIRTPLNAIMGFIDILKEEEKEPRKLQYLNTIDSSSKTLINIINDILDFTKIENGKIRIEYNDFDLQLNLRSTIDLFSAKCSEKNLNLIVDMKDLPKYLNGDIFRIKQVLNNLLSNAIKFTPEGKSIFLIVGYKNEALHISVKDEGIGISPEYKATIFESFTQADSSTTREYGGTGLGLSISYNLVSLMGGELKVASEIGKGSEFYFSLPLQISSKAIMTPQKNEHKDFSHLKLLLAEDNEANQLFMETIFKKMKIEFDIANNGIEAIDCFKKNQYDLILMDENMPKMNGIEATKHILAIEKEQNLKHTPVFALTANALEGDREKFLEAGMDEHIAKPVNKKVLTEVLNDFFA